MISRFDQDGNAMLTEDELSEAIWNRYKSFDADGDGKLNQEELTKAVAGSSEQRGGSRTEFLLGALDRFFSRQDKDGDKVVTKDESDDTPWRLYFPYDTNGDGRLEIEEVRKGLEDEIANQNE